MSLRIPLRALLAAMLVLPLLLGVLSTTTQAAPEPATTVESSTVTAGALAADDTAPHFGFASVLNQIGATSVTKSASPTSSAPGGTITFTVTVTAPPLTPPNNVLPTSFVVRDFLGSGLTFVSGSAAVGSGVSSVVCSPSSGGTTPSGADTAANQLQCSLTVPSGTTTATFTLQATLNAGTFSGNRLVNVACAGNVGDPSALFSTFCGSATVTVTPTGAACPFGTQAVAFLSGNGVTAQFITITPGTGGIGIGLPFISSTSSNQFVLNVLGITATPTLTVQTTTGTEHPSLTLSSALNPSAIFPSNVFGQGGPFGFNPFQPGQMFVGSLSGTPVQGGTVTLDSSFSASGTIQCIPIQPPQLPPPPPLQFVPPPPPPLLPPPPPAPMQGRGAPLEVPVIPEADSLFLLAGGLAILGGLVVARTLRRRDDA